MPSSQSSSVHTCISWNGQKQISNEVFSLRCPLWMGVSAFTTFRTWEIFSSSATALSSDGLKSDGFKSDTIKRFGVFRLQGHCERLIKTSATLQIEHSFTSASLCALVKQNLCSAGPQALKIRLVLHSTGLSIFSEPYVATWGPEKLLTVKIVHVGQLDLTRKITFAPQQLKLREEALASNCDEALLIDENGFLLEGAWSSLFWFDRTGRLYTSKWQTLAGITQGAICDWCPTQTAKISWAEFSQNAQEVFLTQSTSGITPVSVISEDGREQWRAQAGFARSSELIELFNTRLTDELEPL